MKPRNKVVKPRRSRAQRLSPRAVAEHLIPESAAVARIVRTLRKTVLETLPDAAEAFKFHVLCYYHADAFFKSIGGNVCMIEIKNGPRGSRGVILSFIRGAALPDPHGLLLGGGKFKRFVPIPDAAAAKRPEIIALIRAADALPPMWD